MAFILSLDATTAVCSVAIHQAGKLIASEFIAEPRAASSRLLVAAQELLQQANLQPKELTAIAVSAGPGSYTGLRIGTSAAKGICMALNIPLIAVNSLRVMAESVMPERIADFYCPMIDARRMEVYSCLFDQNGAEINAVEAKILTSESFQNELKQGKIAFFGDGSDKFKTLTNHPNTIFVEGVQPDAKNLGVLAFQKFKSGQFEDIAEFEPFYLKDFLIKKP